MRRALGVLPLAILGAACGLRPWTPSVSVAFWAEDVPAGRMVAMPRTADVARAWQPPPENPWSRWYKGTLASVVDAMGAATTSGMAVLPDVRSLEVVGEADAAASNLAKTGLPADVMFVVDLRGAASCAFAARLSHESKTPISPVVTFNNWPASASVVPADETLAGLLAFAPKLPEANAVSTPVFVLDSWRLAYRYDKPDDDVFDNRYMLMPSDLPDAAALQAQGITRIVYVVEDLDDAEVEEDDLNASFREYQAAGIGIYMVDLDFLKSVRSPEAGGWRADWAARLSPRSHWVRERYTLVNDPFFYARARAGFGFAYGRPSFGPGGYRGGGGYGTGGYGTGGSGG